MEHQELIEKVKSFVKARYDHQTISRLPFHHLGTIQSMVDQIESWADSAGLKKGEKEILLIAAWFFQTGRTADYADFPTHSIQLVRQFLSEIDYPKEKIDQVTQLIETARQQPEATESLAALLWDGQHLHYGHPDYRAKLPALRYESEVLLGQEYDHKEWLDLQYQKIKAHRFISKQAKKDLEDQRETNRKALRKERKSIIKPELQKVNTTPSMLDGSKTAQMMFKTTLRNHIDLTNIADNKANIMLSINALIISIAMPLLARELMIHPYLLPPTTLLLLTCVVSIIYATLATRPVKTTGQTSLDVLKNGGANLFFFGNFHKMGLQQYNAGIREVLANDELLDESIIQDLYYLGKTLGRKFDLLRICYAIFTIGITITVISFGVSFLIWATPPAG